MMKKSYSFSIDTSKLKNARAKRGENYVPTDMEHIANMITHGVWILPSLYGTKLMHENATSWKEVYTLLIYGLALFFLFTMSTVYHCISFAGAKGLLRHCFHMGDRAVIYIFIASSYTPWLVLKDFGGVGYLTMWIVWVGCILGILYQFLFHHKYKSLEVFFYMVVGICPAYAVTHMIAFKWCYVTNPAGQYFFSMFDESAYNNIYSSLTNGLILLYMGKQLVTWKEYFEILADSSGVFELAVGGVIYVAGVVFFKMDGVIPFAHAIWHCFVCLGALAHFYAINKYLVGLHASQLQGLTDF